MWLTGVHSNHTIPLLITGGTIKRQNSQDEPEPHHVNGVLRMLCPQGIPKPDSYINPQVLKALELRPYEQKALVANMLTLRYGSG